LPVHEVSSSTFLILRTTHPASITSLGVTTRTGGFWSLHIPATTPASENFTNSDDQATPPVTLVARIADARSDVGFGHIETITERR
jgi:hypothetical protein